MKRILSVKNCSGCGACASKCSQKCIKMIENSDGFVYPYIDVDVCINCNTCESACPVLNPSRRESAPTVYAVNSKDNNVRRNSSSGGVFSLISEYVLNHNGVVFGAAFNKSDFSVNHIYVEDINDLSLLRGSKYIQSNIGNSYISAESFLKNGRLVLFTGTPCQIAGLKSFLKKDYSNLICQDLVCHGCSSFLVFQKYLDYVSNKTIDDIESVSFRNKKYGWNNFSVSIRFRSKHEYNNIHTNDPFMRAFLFNLSLRDSCYDCPFKDFPYISDITLADYWGVSRFHPELNDDLGTSLVIVNSNKGKELFDLISDGTEFCKADLDEARMYNPTIFHSVKRPEIRDAFFNDLRDYDFSYANTKYLRIGKKELYRTYRSRILKRFKKFLHK